MQIRTKAILLLFLCLIMGACFYSNDGIYYAEPVPGDPAIDTIITSLDSLDVPEVKDSMDLEVGFRMHLLNGEPYFVDCWMDYHTLYRVGIYYSSEGIVIAHPDTVIHVDSDTTVFVSQSDTVFSFVIDTTPRSYFLEGSFQVPWDLEVESDTNTLNMEFYFSANTNSLADIIRTEAEVTEREYKIIFVGGEGQ